MAGGVAAAATAAWVRTHVQVRSVYPGPDALLASAPGVIRSEFRGAVSSARLTIDGKPIEAVLDAQHGDVTAVVGALADGVHDCAVSYQPRYGGGAVGAAWRFTLDTRPPGIALYGPKDGAMLSKAPCQVAGHTEPGAAVTLSLSPVGAGPAKVSTRADARGSFHGALAWVEGPALLTVQSRDRAGNEATLQRHLFFDKTPPQVLDCYPAPDAQIKKDPTVTFRARVVENGSGIAKASFQLDEFPPRDLAVDASGRVSIPVPAMVQGRHTCRLRVTDRAGLQAEHVWNLLVDTSETFGECVLGRGAVGRDVGALQKRLEKRGFLPPGSITDIYNDATEAAVRAFQMHSGINVDGLAGFATLGALSPQIRIDLAHFTLELRDMGKVVKRYKIAHGMPAYPTPAGDFRVTFLQKDPTWLPPKGSLWAKEAKVTPPGPGNPLGTRWIGLNSSCVGIHGTYAEWTVGTRASHGCVRMRIKDVEDLFGRVNLGTRVSIFWKQAPHSKAKHKARKKWSNPNPEN